MLVHGSLGERRRRHAVSAAARPPTVEHLPSLRRELSPRDDYAALARVLDDPARLPAADRPHAHGQGRRDRPRRGGACTTGRAGTADRARVVHTYHGHVLEGYFSPAKTRAVRRRRAPLARSTDRIVAISPAIRDELLRRSPHRPRRSVPRRAARLRSRRRSRPIDDRARAAARAALGIAAAAHVVDDGRPADGDQAASICFSKPRGCVADADPAAMFLIAGDGELRATRSSSAARDLGLADRVRFLGWRRDLTTIYGATDVFLLTSRNEGTPVALIESLAAGVPGVSTDVGGVRDVIDSDAVGLPRAVRRRRGAGARHVSTLLGDRDARRAMGARGRAVGRRALRHRSPRRRHRRAVPRAAALELPR